MLNNPLNRRDKLTE